MSLYNGPVTILRRNRDEIMQKNPQITSQNRANNLLMAFLEQRYPHLLTKSNKALLDKGLAIGRQRDFDHWIGTVSTCQCGCCIAPPLFRAVTNWRQVINGLRCSWKS